MIINPNQNSGAFNTAMWNQNHLLKLPIQGWQFDTPQAYSDYIGSPTPTSAGGASGGSGGAASSGGFNLHPQPTSGQGAFGAVPGQLGLPDPAGDLARQVPGLSGLNSSASAGIQAKLNGELSPGTLNALKNASAQYGVSSGMPGSGLSSNQFLGNVAGASEAQQAAGIQQYNSYIPTVSGTQTVNPALQNEIATQNSLNAAAPDPTQAASYAKQLFDQYLAQMRGPGGGTSGGPGGGSGAAAINRAAQSSLAAYESDLDRRLALARATPSGYFNPQSAPQGGSGQGSFGGSSSYIPAVPSSVDDINSYYPQFDPGFDYNTSPWDTELYGTQQQLPEDFYWE